MWKTCKKKLFIHTSVSIQPTWFGNINISSVIVVCLATCWASNCSLAQFLVSTNSHWKQYLELLNVPVIWCWAGSLQCLYCYKLINTLLFLRAWVVRRSTKWTYAANRLPSRYCSSTGIQTQHYLWSSLCRPPTTSVQCWLHQVPPPACRGSPSQSLCTPPPTLPLPSAARTLSAQTTRWCCQNMMKCWRHRQPLLMCRWVRSGTLIFKHFNAF